MLILLLSRKFSIQNNFLILSGESRRTNSIPYCRLHGMPRGRFWTGDSLSLLQPTVGRLVTRFGHHVFLWHIRCHAMLYGAYQGKYLRMPSKIMHVYVYTFICAFWILHPGCITESKFNCVCIWQNEYLHRINTSVF